MALLEDILGGKPRGQVAHATLQASVHRARQMRSSASHSTFSAKRSPWRARLAAMRRMSQMSVPMP